MCLLFTKPVNVKRGFDDVLDTKTHGHGSGFLYSSNLHLLNYSAKPADRSAIFFAMKFITTSYINVSRWLDFHSITLLEVRSNE